MIRVRVFTAFPAIEVEPLPLWIPSKRAVATTPLGRLEVMVHGVVAADLVHGTATFLIIHAIAASAAGVPADGGKYKLAYVST
jgi:hypothetical protein